MYLPRIGQLCRDQTSRSERKRRSASSWIRDDLAGGGRRAPAQVDAHQLLTENDTHVLTAEDGSAKRCGLPLVNRRVRSIRCSRTW